MEDVLSVYERPYDPLRPLVCIDERLKELHGTPKGSLPPEPGQAKRQDYEYERNGSCNTFMIAEPLVGKRYIHVTQRRTSVDFAEQLKLLVDEVHPEAEMIVLVTDNLNTHSRAALYERFPPEEAMRIANKIEWHYTPEHGSWLNIAEIELSVLSRECLNRRIATIEEVRAETTAWQNKRNQANSKIRWQFTNAHARIKLRRLYPQIT